MLLQIMVIGIACTMSDWTPRLLRALAAHREVIIYDSAGIGQSTIEAGWSIGPADYFKFQGDTLAGLIKALQLDVAPDVLGWCARIAHTQLIPTDCTRSHYRVLRIPRRTCWQASSQHCSWMLRQMCSALAPHMHLCLVLQACVGRFMTSPLADLLQMWKADFNHAFL